jgi:sialate O-acetylesterase
MTTTILGVIWYQGDSKAQYNTAFYNCTLPQMIKQLRSQWSIYSNRSTNENFPFGFIQLANWNAEIEAIGNYPWIRFHQTADYGYVPNPFISNLFIASAVDLADSPNYHDQNYPRHKEDVSRRLVSGALNLAYRLQLGC